MTDIPVLHRVQQSQLQLCTRLIILYDQVLGGCKGQDVPGERGIEYVNLEKSSG